MNINLEDFEVCGLFRNFIHLQNKDKRVLDYLIFYCYVLSGVYSEYEKYEVSSKDIYAPKTTFIFMFGKKST